MSAKPPKTTGRKAARGLRQSVSKRNVGLGVSFLRQSARAAPLQKLAEHLNTRSQVRLPVKIGSWKGIISFPVWSDGLTSNLKKERQSKDWPAGIHGAGMAPVIIPTRPERFGCLRFL